MFNSGLEMFPISEAFLLSKILNIKFINVNSIISYFYQYLNALQSMKQYIALFVKKYSNYKVKHHLPIYILFGTL